ncbi:hypothetical protein HN937_16970 [Candidatus Poribacteria bacterium]|jgi:hypothetical protein|nr:hypothetical protein [Candidatus Poribacteria bacterium]
MGTTKREIMAPDAARHFPATGVQMMTRQRASAIAAVVDFAADRRVAAAWKLTVSAPSEGTDGLTRVHVESTTRCWRVIFATSGEVAEVLDW